MSNHSPTSSWVAVAVIPVAAVIALLVGYFLTGLLEPDSGPPALWADALTALVMIAIVAVPTLFAVRAARSSGERGRAPRLAALLLGGAVMVWFAGGFLWNWLVDGSYS